MSKALMIQGTGSGVGKSLIVTALCRIFRDMGINVAPFKSQNMSLNSYITAEGGEIGRAQALQAEAAKIEPTVDMNPILLKVSGEMGSQVIIHGKVYANMKADEYYAFKSEAWEAAKTSFDKLSKKHDLIIIEGAGSPAEINLMSVDIVNMSVAKYAKAPVILVGDIDKGGVFASLYGTVKLLAKDSRYIKGFIINKFRGDLSILNPGLEMIRQKTRKPVIGVLPYISDLNLPEEDGLSLYGNSKFNTQNSKSETKISSVKIVIVKLQYISNFTDFDPFLYEPDVEIVYSRNPVEIENADIVIIPGSKNTVKDLLFLREYHLIESINRAHSKGVQVIGICGGYQMLGKKIYDPYGVESSHKEINGIGLLNIETTLQKIKTTCQVKAEFVNSLNSELKNLAGYEIHMGVTTGDVGLFKIKRMQKKEHRTQTTERRQQNAESRAKNQDNDRRNLDSGFCVLGSVFLDGSTNGSCWGTYIHGIFENDSFRREIINYTRKQKGLPPINSSIKYCGLKDMAIETIANIVKYNVDMNYLQRILKLTVT